MKKVLITLMVVGLLTISAVSFAHGPGGGNGPGGGRGQGGGGYGPGSGHGPGYGMMGGGYGGGYGMMGGGYGGGYGMMGGQGGYGMMGGYGIDKEKFEATSELRKSIHDKMFDYREASIVGDKEKIEKLAAETVELHNKLREQLGVSETFGKGFGPGYGNGQGCNGPRW